MRALRGQAIVRSGDAPILSEEWTHAREHLGVHLYPITTREHALRALAVLKMWPPSEEIRRRALRSIVMKYPDLDGFIAAAFDLSAHAMMELIGEDRRETPG